MADTFRNRDELRNVQADNRSTSNGWMLAVVAVLIVLALIGYAMWVPASTTTDVNRATPSSGVALPKAAPDAAITKAPQAVTPPVTTPESTTTPSTTTLPKTGTTTP